MDIIKQSLGVKVILLSSLLTITAFTGLFFYNSYVTRSHTLHEVELAAKQVGDMLYMAIEEPMAVGDNEGTAHKFSQMAKRYKTITAYLTDYKGEITYSTDPKAIRKDIFKVRPEEADLVRESLTVSQIKGSLMNHGGNSTFAEVKTINNGPACHHCHGKSRKILGTMLIEVDVNRQFDVLKASQVKSAGISVFGVIALLTALIIFMRSSVVNRITSIAATTEEVSKGDLNAKFTVSGSDELGNLSRYLGEMVDQIKDQLQYNRSVLEGIVVPLFVTDAEGYLQFVNPPLLDILAMTEDEVKGRTARSVFGSDNEDCNITEVMTSGLSSSGDFHHTRSTDKAVFPLHFETSPLKDAEGDTVGGICVLVDLTREEQDKKDIEAQRQNLLVVANDVTEVANKLNEASDVLSDQMNNLARGVDTTADQTSQVATAMEEMNATVLEVDKNASETADASNRANQDAADGGVVVGTTVDEIKDRKSVVE